MIGKLVKSLFGRPPKKSRSKKARPALAGLELRSVSIIRGGKIRKADEAFYAWTSGDLPRMLKAMETPTHPVDRHFLLQSIVRLTYKERKANPEMRDLCEAVAWQHLNEFPSFLEELKREFVVFPHVPVFEHLATVLTEKGDYKKAVEVCEKALSYGLRDSTKGGYEGRIERIRKKQQREEK